MRVARRLVASALDDEPAPLRLECFVGDFYEPFVVVRSCGKPAPPPLFDERFAGYGKNKLDWISSLRDANFTFLAAKRAWIAHAPHAASDAKRKWASERRPGARGATGARRRKDLMFGERDAAATATARVAKESEIANFKGSFLGRFPLVSDDVWTIDHLSERSRSVDAFPGTRARGILTLKRR